MDPLIFRAIERIMVVLIGGISVYLGYLLFIKLPQHHDSTGKVVLPGDISIYLSRVGPGVFFALFGTAVVTASLYFSLTVGNSPSAIDADGQLAEGGKFYSYFGGTGATLEQNRSNAAGDIYLLNRLESALDGDLKPSLREDIKRAIPRIKLAILLTVWGDGSDWGAYEEFQAWVDMGEGGALSPDSKAPAKIYNQGR